MRASQPADFAPNLSHQSEVPLYRQLYEHIALRIRSGELARGERLPATRELAGLLGLNRTTVSAAYDVLETEGLIAGQVGRGSFVTGAAAPAPAESTGSRCSTAAMFRRRAPRADSATRPPVS
jgi:DNA-binding transcriptional regulator YhcF (GntR family)